MEQAITTVTSVIMSSGENKPYINPDDVSFKVEYKESYNGPKYMPEGEVTLVNKDLAAEFEKRGIGRIVKGDEAEATSTDQNSSENRKPYAKMNKAELQAELKKRGIEFEESLKNAEMAELLAANDNPENKD